MRCYLKLIMLLGYKKSSASNKLLVITLSNRADSLILKMQNEYAWMVQVTSIAILDTDMIGSKIRGIKVRGNSDNILDLAKRHIIDEVFIDLPYEHQSNLEDVILELEKMGIILHININIYHNLKIQEKIIGNYIGFHVITFATQVFDERQVLLKRLIDILGGLIGTIVMVLLIVIVAPMIKLESAGPIFFSQTRVGKNGRKFKIFKFRSMYQDAEERKKELLEQNEMSGIMFKMNNDPRITKIGKFIRKVSIDEFPQFLNVLKGDMSLVGTRPPTIDEFEQYETLHRRRLSIKPGITGLWQISGRSSITDFDEVVKLDLEYIDHWSLALDIKIIFKTIYVVLFGKGAV
jgi:exopolysaccharide biosynthesis polyprenyl glycosylphosphotransferase